MTILADSALAPSEPTVSQELAALAAEYSQWRFWNSDCGRHYAVIRTRYSGFTVYALDPASLRQEIAEASWALEHLSARDERRAAAVAA